MELILDCQSIKIQIFQNQNQIHNNQQRMDPEGQKKYSYLDEFKILKTLGAGYHAQVKLGMDDQGNLYAIKRYKKQTANLGTLQHELNIMKVLQHQNLVRLIDVRENAVYKRKDQTTYNCFAIILEYVGGGELFDFIAETGKFSEKVTRTYFHQMMNGLHYMHQKGYAHRDIKPENILLGRDFVLKLADFGFSCMIKGKDGTGILHTKLGTEGYMAPEVPTKNYQGAKADIFAAGVILFIMYAGNPPFEKAAPNDPYYKLIKDKNYATFWKAHSRRRPVNYFNDSFKDIFVRMAAFNPTERPAITEIAAHPWVNNAVCSQSQIRQQFEQRLKELDVILQQRRQEQEAKKVHNMQSAGNMGGNRGDVDIETSPFLEIYETEQDTKRNFKHLEPIQPEDFVIEENSVYAIAVLKEFFKNSKIPIEDEKQVIGGQILALRPIQVNDNEDGVSAKYELKDQVDGIQFTENIQIRVRFGTHIHSNDKHTVQVRHLNGNWFYFKKIAIEIRNLYAYCKI